MTEPERIRHEIKRILVDVLALDVPPEQIGDLDMLFAHGMDVDSVEALEIVREMEKRFSIRIDEQDIGIAMFHDVTSLASAVEAARVSGGL
jgi:acyl carrier protein